MVVGDTDCKDPPLPWGALTAGNWALVFRPGSVEGPHKPVKMKHVD